MIFSQYMESEKGNFSKEIKANPSLQKNKNKNHPKTKDQTTKHCIYVCISRTNMRKYAVYFIG